MSTQSGLIKLDGKIGGISFYRSDGKDLARLAKGPSKKKILTDPAFIRTRENNAEFGGSATAAKALRLAVALVIISMGDRYMSSRLTKVFKEINAKGAGARGQRSVTLSTNRSMIENFEFNEKTHFSSVFNAPFSSAINAARTQGTITIPNFSPGSFIQAPAGATHFRLVAALGVVSDYNYNVTSQHYEPTDPNLNMLSAMAYGAMTALNVTAPVNFSLVTALAGTPTMTATVSAALCLGIEFYQHVGTSDYVLAQNNCMKVLKLF